MSNSVWYISVSKKKLEFKKYPSKQKNKKTVKKTNQKSTNSSKKLLINLILASSLIFFLSIVSAAPINDTFHINLQTTFSNGSIETGTFAFAFNITDNSSTLCGPNIVYNHSVSRTTDTRAIVSLYLPTAGSGGGNLSTLNYDTQYYLCYYRDGALKNVSQLGRVPYAFRATQVNLSEISVDSNLTMPDYNISADYGFFNFLGNLANRITNLFIQDINASGDINFTGLIYGNGSQLTDISADTLDSYNSTFFMPLNTSVYGTFDFNGGWTGGGLSIDGGDLYAQTIYIYNITSLNVTEQNLTIVDDLIVFGNTELKKNLTVDTDTLFVDSNTDRVGIGTTTPQNKLNVIGDINFTGLIYGNGSQLTNVGGVEVDPYWTGNQSLYYLKNNPFGFYNLTSFEIDDYYLKNNPFSFYNSTDFSISDYYSKNNPFGFYNSTNPQTETDPFWTGNQSSYFNTTDIIGFSYYNSTDFDINDYLLESNTTLAGNFSASTDFCIESGTCLSGAGGGGMSNFILGASSGTNQTITDGNTAFIAAGTGITTTSAATDKVTVAATLGTAIEYGEITSMTEANLYSFLSDVSQFYESGDKVGDADTLDTIDSTGFCQSGGSGCPAGASDQNLWETMTGDSGSVAANAVTDSFAITGGGTVTTAISGDGVIITGSGHTTDTSANTVCAGTAVYMDGDGGCDTVYTDTTNTATSTHHVKTVDTSANTVCAGTAVYMDGDGGCDTVYTDTTNTATSTHHVKTVNTDYCSGGSCGALSLSGNLAMGANDITNVDKIDANTYDPIYDIGGIKYATYLPGMIGIKEEVTGTVRLNSSYTIDLKNLKIGSDLWLFYQTTDFGLEMENLQIILTPGFNGGVWYEKNPEKNTLTIHGTQAGEVSYRMTANRFDWSKWGIYYEGESTGMVVPLK